MDLKAVLKRIEDSEEDMIAAMSDMIRIPAIGPMNGGPGETERADRIMGMLTGFDSVERMDVEDTKYPGVIRPNILARKNGGGKGTVWIVSHMDTVLPGDPEEWETPPYEPTLKGRRLYGLGTEDNGQAVIASIFGSRFIVPSEDGMSIGLAIVADEETTSLMGIDTLINADVFSSDDVIIVPDWGVPGGTMIEVAEKHLIWLKVTVEGKQTHGSTPNRGINAFRVSTKLLAELMDRLETSYPGRDPMFRPDVSTFEPTKSPGTVGNVNTIPGYDEFHMDIRMLPSQDPDGMIAMVRGIAAEHAKRTGAVITVEVEQRTFAGRPSRTDTEGFTAFRESVMSVIGKEPETVGVGGGTCANFFRLAGLDAYVWQTGGGSLHQPNEYCDIDNLISDAKVYATLFRRLCV